METTGIVLPADDAVRSDVPVQWWYWTGHLEARDGRRFGFEQCFFVIDAAADFFGSALDDEFLRDALSRDVEGFQVAHCALTDVAGQTFHSRVDYVLGMPRPCDNGFDLRTKWPVADKVIASGGDGSDRLHGDVGGCVFDLELVNSPDHPPVLHYGGQRHDFAFGGFVYYYSRPHMIATGTVSIDGETLEVSGVAWFDREFGVLGQLAKQSWQWFAIELDDGRQIMVADINGYPSEGFCTLINGAETQVSGERMPTGWIFSTTGKARIPASCIRRTGGSPAGPTSMSSRLWWPIRSSSIHGSPRNTGRGPPR